MPQRSKASSIAGMNTVRIIGKLGSATIAVVPGLRMPSTIALAHRAKDLPEPKPPM